MAITVTTTYSSNTIEPDVKHGVGAGGVAGQKGVRNKGSLQSIFKDAPVVGYTGTADGLAEGNADHTSAALLKQWFFNNVVKGTDNNGGGAYGLATVDKEFGNNAVDGAPSPPNLTTQALTAPNKPANGFVPNPASPGEGEFTADKKAVAPTDFTDKLTANGAAFSGDNIVTVADLKAQAKKIVDRQGPAAADSD